MTQTDQLLAHVARLLPDYEDNQESGYAPKQLADETQALEARIGTRLPQAYYDLYEAIDGDSFGLAFGWFFAPLGRAMLRLQADADGWYARPDNPDQVKPQSHSARRIPIVEDYGSSVIYLDYDPAPGGTAGQLILIFRDYPYTIYSVAPSLDAFLTLLLAEFEAGRVEASEDEEYLRFACQAGPNYVFWADLSNRYRTAPPALPADTAARVAVLPALWREKTAQANGDFLRTDFGPDELHRVREVLVNDPAMLDDLENVLLFPQLDTLTVYAHPLSAAHLAIIAQTKVAFLTLAGPLPSLAPLAQLPGLRRLTLVDATLQPDGLAPLIALSHLETLELEMLEVPDLRPLASLSSLQALTLKNSAKQPGLIPVPLSLPPGSWTDAALMEFLSQQPAWEPRPAQWPSLAVLGPLPRLQSLDVSGTNFDDLGVLRVFPQLRHVGLAGCPITDFAAVRDLPNGVSFAGDGAFLEGVLAVAPDKGFRFGSISGKLTEAQKTRWKDYNAQQQAAEPA